MLTFLRKYRLHIFSFIIVFFLLYIVLGFGASFFGRSGSLNEPIAEVGGEKIPVRLFYSHYQRSLSQVPPGTTLDENAKRQRRDEALRDLVQGVVFAEEARRYGIQVPDEQVAMTLAQIPAFQDQGAFNPGLYGQALRTQLHTTPQDFEEEQRRFLAFMKLRWLLQSVVKVTEDEAAQAFAHGGAAQLRAVNEERRAQKQPPLKMAEFRQGYAERLQNEKTLAVFNQWIQQVGQRMQVKTHLDILEGVPQ